MTAVEMSISFDGLNWSAWEAAQSKRTVTLPAGDGVKTVYMKLRDAAGNEQTVVSDTIKLDTTPPTIGLSINAGSMSTTSRQVTLSISGSDANGPLEYRRANEDEDWTSWEPLPGPNWELTAGDGLKTVKLEVRDPAGNVAALSKTITLNTVGPSVTGVVNGGIYNSDVVISFDKGTATLNNASFINNTTVTQEGTYKLNITDIAGFETEVNFIIDKTAPSGSFTINNGAATTSSAQVNLSITAFDNLGQIEMRMAHENDAWSSWQPYTSALTWTLPNGNGQKKVLLELRDEAGNIGRASASITLFMKSSGGGGGGGIPTPSAPEKPKEPVFEPDEPNSPAPTFSDITGYWAESYIKQASAKGIIGGYPDGTFKANASITRAEFTVMLVNALKLEGAAASSEFSDDKQIGAWAKQAIDRALQAGIIAGYDDGSFRPSAAITRAEMAVMFARAMDLQINTNAVSPFADDKAIPEWAKGAVDALHRIGIVNGRGKNRFDPNGPVTRAEATAMLIRMLERKENQ
ncbi:MAG TPA: S-layer homology domain-containing protein [Bacilli bacterium]|nr:S-layer homology domain-containing protein [Bacilli bacterium]